MLSNMSKRLLAIALATAAATPTSATGQTAYVFEQPISLELAEGYEMRIDPSQQYVTIISLAESRPPSATGIWVPSEVEAQVAGKELLIEIEARSGLAGISTSLAAAYYTYGSGNSGVLFFEVKPEFTTISFRYSAPPKAGEPDVDLLAIYPGVPDSEIDVRAVRIIVTE